MPQYLRLPSGLIVNLSLVTRIVPVIDESTVTIYFSGGDSATLGANDTAALRKGTSATTALSSNVKTLIFWLVILTSVTLVWFAVRHRPVG